MQRIVIDTPVYQLPQLHYDLLVIETDNQTATHEYGQVAAVEVPNGGVTLHYRSGGGGQEMQPSVFVTYQPPEPPKNETKLPMGPAPLPQLKPPAPAPAPEPKGETLQVSDNAEGIVEKK